MDAGGSYSEVMSEMKLRLAARGIEVSRELKDFIERRAHFGFGRFNGPRGGVDQRCDILSQACVEADVAAIQPLGRQLELAEVRR